MLSLFLLFSFLSNMNSFAGAPVVPVGTKGEFYFQAKKRLSCDSFVGRSVIWKSEKSDVVTSSGSYECLVTRSAEKEHTGDCDKIADTELASGPSETRNFTLVEVRKSFFILDFSQKPNALMLNCKANQEATDFRKSSASDFKKILSGFDVQIKKMDAVEPTLDKIKYDEPIPKSTPTAI